MSFIQENVVYLYGPLAWRCMYGLHIVCLSNYLLNADDWSKLLSYIMINLYKVSIFLRENLDHENN